MQRGTAGGVNRGEDAVLAEGDVLREEQHHRGLGGTGAHAGYRGDHTAEAEAGPWAPVKAWGFFARPPSWSTAFIAVTVSAFIQTRAVDFAVVGEHPGEAEVVAGLREKARASARETAPGLGVGAGDGIGGDEFAVGGGRLLREDRDARLTARRFALGARFLAISAGRRGLGIGARQRDGPVFLWE